MRLAENLIFPIIIWFVVDYMGSYILALVLVLCIREKNSKLGFLVWPQGPNKRKRRDIESLKKLMQFPYP
jgi:hypothetical protein